MEHTQEQINKLFYRTIAPTFNDYGLQVSEKDCEKLCNLLFCLTLLFCLKTPKKNYSIGDFNVKTSDFLGSFKISFKAGAEPIKEALINYYNNNTHTKELQDAVKNYFNSVLQHLE